jgi:O-antigen/teichoic acid export membrane protein
MSRGTCTEPLGDLADVSARLLRPRRVRAVDVLLGETRSGGIARNATLQLVAQLTSGAFSLVILVVLTRALSPEGFGLFALAVGVGALLMLPSDLGISASTERFIAEQRDSRGAMAAVASHALSLKLATSGLVSIVLFASAGHVARLFGEDDLAWPLRGVALAILGQGLVIFCTGTFLAQGRAEVNLRMISSESAVETAATVALVLAGAGATGAAFGRAVGYLVGAVLGLVLVARLLGPGAARVRRPGGEWTGRIFRYAGLLALSNWATTFLAYVDTLIIGALLTASAVGLFQAPMRIIPFLLYPAFAIAYGVAPLLARRETESPNVAAFSVALRILIVLYAALVPALVVWPGPIVELLFGPDYAESAEALRVLAPYVFLAGLAPLVSFAANYLGAAARRLPIALAALLVNVGVDLVLVREIGIVGAAIGIGLAFALYVPGHLLLCRRLLEFPLRPLLTTFVRSILAAAAMAAVLLVVGTAALSPGEWLLGAGGGALAFVAVLVATGELKLSEVRAARTALSRRGAGLVS